ncbi:GRIP and coiled-coil domain-containing protein 2 [Danio aesculapii]|uniref:GRIP and coiled-coil domain-containing protein 2 n=1 Tax=Danio aesculapii TaxID=1142201 RepID=UPI0024BF6A03|nr:GRIP and coiled-coil domain-containing protein 2 [Danio aesculapii]
MMEDCNPESVASPAGQSSGRSKLDTLSKEDLIKFAKKQMVAMQKMKSKCADLEQQLEVQKRGPVSDPADSSIIQELTERMDALLLEKAESQQSLGLLRREHQELRQQAQDTAGRLAALQEELDLKNKEHAEMQKHMVELTAGFKTTCSEYECRISQTQAELEAAQQQIMAATDSQQKSLTEAQQEVENLQAEIQRMTSQYEEDLRFLEEQMELNNADFQRERERLLLLQDELSEQLEQKEGFLQDVQEEEEDSRPPQQTADLPAEDQLRPALEEHLQTHNMMLQEELVLLQNVKLELESELKQVREEFSVEKEELEFRINELQMNKDTGGEMCSASEEEESQNKDLQQAEACLSVERGRQEDEQENEQKDMLQKRQEVRQDNEKEDRQEDEVEVGQDDRLKNRQEDALENKKEVAQELVQEDGLENRQDIKQEVREEGGLENRQEEGLEDGHIRQVVEQVDRLEDRLKNHQEDGLIADKLQDQLSVESLTVKNIILNQDMDLKDKAKHFIKQYRSIKEELAASLLDLQERLKSVLQEQHSPSGPSTDNGGLNLSLEDLWSRNEGILVNLQHEETLVMEMLELMGCGTECGPFHKQEGLMEDERVHHLQEEISTLQALQQESGDVIRLLNSQIQSLSEEKSNLQEHLSAVQCRIAEILQQSSGQAETVASDISTLVEQLWRRCVEKQALLSQRAEEQVEQLRAEQLKVELDSMRRVVEEQSLLSQRAEEQAEQLKTEQLRAEQLKVELDSMRRTVEEQALLSQRAEEKAEQLKVELDSMRQTMEEQALLSQRAEEKAEQLKAEQQRAEQLKVELDSMRQAVEEREVEHQTRTHELQQERDMLKASLADVVMDTEGLQKDLSQVQTMNEKLSTENLRLLAQVSELSSRLEEERTEVSDEPDLTVPQADELQQALADRDTLISQLREEVGHLQKCQESPVSDGSEKLTALSEELEKLKKESKDKDERMNKIKAVAVKAKKELDNSKKEALGLREEADQLRAERDRLSRSVKDIIHGAEDYKNLMVDYDKQTELLDQEKEKLEQAEKHSEDLSRRLQHTLQQTELLSSEREDLATRVETLQSNVRLLEAQILELQKQKSSLERELEAERLIREQKSREHVCAVQEREELQAQLNTHTLQLQNTAQELEQLRKGAQQSSLLDMEMADYEKLVRELNLQLSERERLMEETHTHLRTQKEREQQQSQEIDSLKLLLEQAEEKSSKMKQLLVKTKKDLADAKQSEAAQMSSQSALRGDLEAQQQQLEEYKIQCSELTAERHRLQEQLRLAGEQQHRASSSYQLTVSALQDQLTAAQADLQSSVCEFESYKVRVHNVLKQQKHRSAGQSDSDTYRQEREQLEAVLQQLRSRLQETQLSLQSSTLELQQLQAEHDTLLERHNRMLQESVSKEAELRERLLCLQSECVSLRSEHSQCASHLSAQTEALRSGFREQTRHLQDEHCRTLDTLQQQISRLQTQLFQMQKEPASTGTAQGQAGRRSVERRLEGSQVELQAREEGEGMETIETEPLTSTGTTPPSLEQLLNTAHVKHEPVVWQEEPSIEELRLKLSTASRSVEHLSSLLHETEATNAVLMEQITLLKSELRRLERNEQRERSVANLEYLKNVLLQFIFLRAGTERQALLPVIHTLLQLSPDEKNKLAAIAQGGGEEESAGSRGSGWSSYLHSWSGIR